MHDLVLYRKYRPKNFDQVAGQPQVVKILKNALKLNRIAHAYLFSGPRGTGKTSVARILARAINCEKSDPCNSCDICNEFLSGQTLDLVEIDAASNRGIDEIRAIRDASILLPVRAKRKVYIIDEVHMLTKEAFNALLKTLEEPPEHVVFILATTEPEKVPETISSRTQHFRFRRLPDEIVAKSILDVGKTEGFDVEYEAAQILAFFSEGSLRDAMNLLGQVSILAANENEKQIKAADVSNFLGAPVQSAVDELVAAIGVKDDKRAFECLQTTFKNGSDHRIFMKILIRDFRNRFLNVLEGGQAYSEFSADRLEKILLILLDISSARFYSRQRQLPLELAVSRIIRET
jgi:DNA polymerase III subunit gamma/tau